MKIVRRYIRLNQAIWDWLVYLGPNGRRVTWITIAAVWVLLVWLIWP